MIPSLTRRYFSILLALLLLAAAGQAFGTLKLLPETIGPGGEVRLIGSDYLRDQPLSAMLRDDSGAETLLENFNADADGNFLIDIDIPIGTEPGLYDIVIRAATGLGVDEEPITIVNPLHITLDPESGIPGQPVNIFVGRLTPGTLEVRFDDDNVLGPLPVRDSSHDDRIYVPLAALARGGSEVRVINRVGQRIFGQAVTHFAVTAPEALRLSLINVDMPTHTLVPGERFSVTADVIVPDGMDIQDFHFSLVWKTAAGLMVPINQEPVSVAGNTITGTGAPPGLPAGTFWGIYGEDDELGYVYSTPSGVSGYVRAGGISYFVGDFQEITILVLDMNDEPLEDILVTLDANAQLVDKEVHLEPDTRGNDEPIIEQHISTIEAAYHGPNQLTSARRQALADLIEPAGHRSSRGGGQTPVSCPVTLAHGPTDENGEFTIVTQPFLNELFNRGAKMLDALDINTRFNGPGYPEFTVFVNGLAEGYGPVNSQGKGTVARFDFQYNWDDEIWYLRDDLDGEYTIPFNPNSEKLTVNLPTFSGELQFPAEPYINNLHSVGKIEGDVMVTHMETLVTFPNASKWPQSLFFNMQPAVLSMPFNDLVFGPVTDMKLFLDGDHVADFQSNTAETCTGHDIEYRAIIPNAHRLLPGLIYGTIEGLLEGTTPISAQFALKVETGPDWFLNPRLLDEDEGIWGDVYENQVIVWDPGNVYVGAEEIESDNDAPAQDVDYVGDMENQNATAAIIHHSMKGAGPDASRKREGESDADIVGNSGDTGNAPSEDTDAALSFGEIISFGDENNEIALVDTGKIPLFRYSWGVSPLVGATFGADFWLRVFYRYWGGIEVALDGVWANFQAEPAIQAGLDVFFELSALFGMVSAKAIAQPTIGVALPIVFERNKFDPIKSRPCFRFDLNVLIQLAIIGVGEDFEETLFTVVEPRPEPGEPECTIGASMAALQRIPVPAPADIAPAIAVDSQGIAMTAWEGSSGGISVQAIQLGVAGALMTVDTGPGAIKPALASYGPDKKILVWSQSELEQSEFDALQPVDALPHQHMAYALWNGSEWSQPMDLTLPTTGEGRAVLAACPSDDSNCPSGGQVLAVWERDVAGDMYQHDVRLVYAYFDGLTESWSSVMEVDPGSTAKDNGATAVYAQGEPVIAWIRNALVSRGGKVAEIDLNDNQFAYRWLNQTAGVQIPTDLTMAVASPSLSALSDGSLVMAYTSATEPEAFVGNKQALYTAKGECQNGICTWQEQQMLTSGGRVIFAEGPKVLTLGNDALVVQFRHFGYDIILPSDPLSIQMMTGDVGQIQLTIDNPVSDVQSLTLDGGINWMINPVFDEVSDSVLSVAVNAPLGLFQRQKLRLKDTDLRRRPPGVTTTRLGNDNAGPVLHNVPRLPEMEIIEAHLATALPPEGDQGSVQIKIRNNGVPLVEEQLVSVKAAWNAPPGSGPQAGDIRVPIPQSGIVYDQAMTLIPPPDYQVDDVHQLFIQINPGLEIPEADSSNNTIILTLGELPVPENLNSTVSNASELIYIHWDDVEDDRVTAYRIYRRNPDGKVIHVGTSDVPGFVDQSAHQGFMYQYAVTSLSERVMESDKSAWVHAIARSEEYSNPHGVLFSDRFESPGGQK